MFEILRLVLLATALVLAGLANSKPLVNSPTLNQQETLVESGIRPLDGPVCDCTGTNNTGDHISICGDPRLGPATLPNKFPLLGIISSYDRFGGLQPGQFLEKWWDNSTKYNYKDIPGSWRWPKFDGFLAGPDDATVKATTTLKIGTTLDRFGSPGGKYLAGADGAFNQRALPPSSLNADAENADWPSDYHVYRVIKPLPAVAGLVAPWFGQPGLGSQFYIGGIGNVSTLVQQGYIKRLNKTELSDPHDPSSGGRCGQGLSWLRRNEL